MDYTDAVIKPNAKGQIVIPKIMRETLQIDQKTYLRLKMQGSVIYVEPVKKIIGAGEDKQNIQAILKKTQGAWDPATKEEIAWEKKVKEFRLQRAKRKKKRMVIVDTNIIIEHLRKPKGANTFFREILGTYPLGTVGISVLSIQELYEGKSMDDFADEQYAKEAISLLQVLGYKAEVARLAGEIARHNRTAMDFPDAGIAATAIANNATLITYNTKDFKDIKGLELL